MWRKIKSTFILKKIFNIVDSKIKFETIVYNKNIQRKFGLNLIDFKRFSCKYRVEENEKIKEYNSYNDKLIFEGYYSNGKRNGKGIEFNEKGKLIFEGEYLNGKKWKGTEKIYDQDTGKLIFQCQYLNGIMDGEAEEYDKFNGDLLFKGNYLKEKRNGKGIEYKFTPRGNKIKIFEGEYINGERKKGKEYNYDENIIVPLGIK